MCGIVGYLSKTDKMHEGEKEHFMRYALSMDTLRGADSTGIMTLTKRFEVNTIKTLMPGDKFVQSPRYQKNWQPGWCQVGHNRAATRGTVNRENAHPFSFGDITLVHNGTLWADGNSLPTYNKELNVDSMQIAHALAEHAPEESKDVLADIDGSFALVWFDKRDESVNMARNADRPMHYGLNTSKEILWFMSDGHMLRTIIKSMGHSSAAPKSIFVLERLKFLKWRKGELVPEVTTLDPFARHFPSSQRQSGGSGSSKDTPLEQATEKWKRVMEETGSTEPRLISGCEYPKVRLGGSLRKIPKPMLDALKKEYDLTPNSLLQFKPLASTPYDNIHHQVRGTVIHEEWGGWEVEAILFNAKTVQIGAYMDTTWLVKPVGLTFPWDPEHEVPGLMVQLVHCDWNSYVENRDREDKANEELEKEAADDPKVIPEEGWVLGPGHVYMDVSRISAAWDCGCISCGMELRKEEIGETMLVNEGRDLLCPQCIEDYKKYPKTTQH